MNRLLSYKFEGTGAGPHLLILGAIHGHEPCGMLAISRLITELNSQVITLISGQITLMPLCNPLAYRAGQRYVQEDLNRIIGHYPQPRHAEQEYASQVAAAIEAADVVLDLHSATTGQGPSLFLDFPTAVNLKLATAMNIPDWVVGWPQLYDDTPELPASDTQLYAHQRGKRTIFIECGQHHEPEASTVAYQSIRRMMAVLGLLPFQDTAPVIEPRIAKMNRFITRDKAGQFAADWQHLQVVPAGTILINYDDGTFFKVDAETILVLPRPYAKMGGEWMCLASSITKSQLKLSGGTDGKNSQFS